MNAQELERAKRNVRVDLRRAELGQPGGPGGPDAAHPGQTPASIVLYLPSCGPPAAMLTDRMGRVTTKVMSYLDLLYTLEESAVVEELAKAPVRHTALPPLPAGTLLVDLYQSAARSRYAITGYIEPATHLFILDYEEDGGGEGEIRTYELPMPHVAWRAVWEEDTRTLRSLSIAFVSPEHEGPVTPETELYHYPFEHVYAGGAGGGAGGGRASLERVCWPALEGMRIEPADIPAKAVAGFLNAPNKAGHAHKIDTLLAESGIESVHRLLTEIERRGAIPHDWLTPAALNVRQLHDQRRRSS